MSELRGIELAQATMRVILDHPERHDQVMWGRQHACGTTACFAGLAVTLAGAELVFDPCDRDTAACIFDGRYQTISELAGDLLGLDEVDKDVLFESTNTVEDLEVMVKNLADGRPIAEGVNPLFD